MHKASRRMLPCNLTVTEQSLQSHTWARGDQSVFVTYAWLFVSKSVRTCVTEGMYLCAHLSWEAFSHSVVCHYDNTEQYMLCWSQGTDLPWAAPPPPVLLFFFRNIVVSVSLSLFYTHSHPQRYKFYNRNAGCHVAHFPWIVSWHCILFIGYHLQHGWTVCASGQSWLQCNIVAQTGVLY